MPRPRFVVLGSGFAGFSLLSNLRRDRLEATLISPRNHFLFTPLLPSATAGTVELRSITEPTRRRLRGTRVLEAAAEAIDPARHLVACRSAVTGETFEIEYDLLALAVGAATADYGVAGVAEHALEVRELADARRVRHRLLEQLAAAETPGLPEAEVARRLTVVVCGGGATGVEVAAELHDLAEEELGALFPTLAPRLRIVLIEALPRLLTGFDDALADYTRQHFGRGGIDVRTSSAVARIEADRVVLDDGEELPAGMVIWAGGNAPRPLIESLGRPLDRGRLRVRPDLSVPDLPGVFALGDCAAVGDPPLPATAQVAQQQGKHLARALERTLDGRPLPPFEFAPMGMLAYVGGGRALADLPRVKWSGRAAWLFWRSVYLTKLVSLSNKAKVLFDWWKAALFGRDTTRF